MGLTILQWNANSLLAHIHEFKKCLDQLDHLPDIICVQETWLKSDTNVTIPGYSFLRQDGKNGRGGVGTFIKSGISYSDFTCYGQGVPKLQPILAIMKK